MFNVVIIGAENVHNYDFFQEKCIYYLKSKVQNHEYIRVLTIGDKYVDMFASKFGIETKKYDVHWALGGKEALKRRNQEIINDSDAVIYFDTNKKNLEYIYNLAAKIGKPRRRVMVSNPL